MHVNVESIRLPSRQFLPASERLEGLAGALGVPPSIKARCLDGETGRASSIRQSLTCRVPALRGPSIENLPWSLEGDSRNKRVLADPGESVHKAGAFIGRV